MINMDRYDRQRAEFNPELRYLNALLSAIGRFAVNGEGWAQMAMTRKSQGQMVGSEALRMATEAILQPLDWEPINVMIDNDDWPEIK